MYNYFKYNIKQYLNYHQFNFHFDDNSSHPIFIHGFLDNCDIYKDYVFTIYSHYHKKYIHILFMPQFESLFCIYGGFISSSQFSILTDSADIPLFKSFKYSHKHLYDIPIDYQSNICDYTEVIDSNMVD